MDVKGLTASLSRQTASTSDASDSVGTEGTGAITADVFSRLLAQATKEQTKRFAATQATDALTAKILPVDGTKAKAAPSRIDARKNDHDVSASKDRSETQESRKETTSKTQRPRKTESKRDKPSEADASTAQAQPQQTDAQRAPDKTATSSSASAAPPDETTELPTEGARVLGVPSTAPEETPRLAGDPNQVKSNVDPAAPIKDAAPTVAAPTPPTQGEDGLPASSQQAVTPKLQTPEQAAQAQDLAKVVESGSTMAVKVEVSGKPQAETSSSTPAPATAVANATPTTTELPAGQAVTTPDSPRFGDESQGSSQNNGSANNGNSANSNGSANTGNGQNAAAITAQANQAANPGLAAATASSPTGSFQDALKATTAGENTASVSASSSVDGKGAQSAQTQTSGVPSQTTTTAQRTEQTAKTERPQAVRPQQIVDQVKVKIAQGGIKGGDTITVQLRPDDLGRVEVKLEVREGHVTAHVIADNADTLNALKADARGLERSLNDAGLKTDAGSLQFSLRGEGDNQQAANQSDRGMANPYGSVSQSLEDDLAPVQDIQSLQTARAAARGGVDIRV